MAISIRVRKGTEPRQIRHHDQEECILRQIERITELYEIGREQHSHKECQNHHIGYCSDVLRLLFIWSWELETILSRVTLVEVTFSVFLCKIKQEVKEEEVKINSAKLTVME